ncbi:MAG: helix-turn-helix domain-containing protein [Planktomarina sp.]
MAVLDCGSFTRAADKRSLTQSAFTRRIKTIEYSLGSSLFKQKRKLIVMLPGVQFFESELRDGDCFVCLPARANNVYFACGCAIADR